jgi:hypothetical protein
MTGTLAYWGPLIVQGVLAVALMLVSVICLRVDRRLRELREGRDGVASTAAELMGAVARAEAAVRALREATGAASVELERQIGEARATGETLKFLASAVRALEPSAPRMPASGQRDLGRDQPSDPASRADSPRFEPSRPERQPAATEVPRTPGRWSGLR